MSTEENIALVRRIFEEGVNEDKPSVWDELLAPDFVIYDPPSSGMEPNREGFRQMFTGFRAAFPDLHMTIEAEFAAGDYVIHRGYTTATHKGEFQGIAATGKQIKVKYIDIWRVANGKAMENWVQLDMLGLMQQLGVVPVPGQGTA
jgi:predicted ester cyclase